MVTLGRTFVLFMIISCLEARFNGRSRRMSELEEETNAGSNHAEAHKVHWAYDGAHESIAPERWGYSYPECRGSSQSPIDLMTVDPTKDNRENFEFSLAWTEGVGAQIWNVTNNGHSLQVNIGSGYTVTGGQLGEETQEDRLYTALQFHFHWRNSEHTVDGRYFPGEMHIVTADNKYGSKASSTHQGLAVLGFFLELQDMDNEMLTPLTSHIEECTGEGDKSQIASFSLMDVISEALDGQYWRYDGSLTTPPCYQSVTWTVFETPIPISMSQYELFSRLTTKQGETMDHQFRPVQPRNCRDVFRF